MITRFRAISDNEKASLVRRLMQNSTPDFDYFYLAALSVAMATMGLVLDSAAIVIGSMLIAPLMYPILGASLGAVMVNSTVFGRSLWTLIKSLLVGVVIAFLTAYLVAGESIYNSGEIMQRIEPSFAHFLVALVAGAAVAYVLARPEWSDTLPGVAIAVALIPPLATAGIGMALSDTVIMFGAFNLLLLNLAGIALAAGLVFALMNVYEQQNVAVSTIRKETEKAVEEKKVIAEIKNDKENKKNKNNETDI